MNWSLARKALVCGVQQRDGVGRRAGPDGGGGGRQRGAHSAATAAAADDGHRSQSLRILSGKGLFTHETLEDIERQIWDMFDLFISGADMKDAMLSLINLNHH